MSALRSMGLAVLCGQLLSACASPPVQFFTLQPEMFAEAVSPAPAPFAYELLPVGIPAQVDVPTLMFRAGGSHIVADDALRWSAPLGDELRSALSSALAQRLGSHDVAGLPRAQGTVLRLKLQVRRFEMSAEGAAVFDADWSLGMAQDDSARLQCHSVFRTRPGGGGYAAAVKAQQAAVLALAEVMARTGRAWVVNHQLSCPEPEA